VARTIVNCNSCCGDLLLLSLSSYCVAFAIVFFLLTVSLSLFLPQFLSLVHYISMCDIIEMFINVSINDSVTLLTVLYTLP